MEEIKNSVEKNEYFDKKSKVIEFFLGKNVIAKIAIFLIFLGIVSFGQLAYVEWLGNIGRVVLIACIGGFFFGLGFFFDHKKMIVYNNVFYAIGIATLMVSATLAEGTYNLINKPLMIMVLGGLNVGVFIYFYKKRFPFLDTFLLVFYTVTLMLSNQLIQNNMNSIDLVLHVFINVLYVIFITIYIIDYFKEHTALQDTIIIALTLFLFVFQIGIYSPTVIYSTYRVFIAVVVSIYLSYLIVIVYLKNVNQFFRFFIILALILVSSMVSYNLYILIDKLTKNYHETMLIGHFVLYLLPIYVISYVRKKDDIVTNNMLLVVIGFGTTLYVFLAGPHLFFTYDVWILNLIHIFVILVAYIWYKYTKALSHRLFGYYFIVLLILRVIVEFLGEMNNMSVDIKVFGFPAMFAAVMIGLNLVYEKVFKTRDMIDNTFVHSMAVVVLIPFVIVFTSQNISNDNSILFVSLIVLLILYRWLLELEVFRMYQKNMFIHVLNLKILLVIFGLNMFYFDHDFAISFHVWKFVCVFLANIYVVKSIHELYQSLKLEMDEEWALIVLYLIGVLIQSFFIHNYINVEFDKVILSSYFMIASAVGILIGFNNHWTLSRKIGLGTIYFSLAKFFIYDFYTQDFTTLVRMITYFILGFTLLGISFLYNYLEKKYG